MKKSLGKMDNVSGVILQNYSANQRADVFSRIRDAAVIELGVLRSKTTPKKRIPHSELWRYDLYLPPELEAPFRAKVAEYGGTLQDGFELAVRAFLKTSPQDEAPPTKRKFTPWDVFIMGQRRTIGMSYVENGRKMGISPELARYYCVRNEKPPRV